MTNFKPMRAGTIKPEDFAQHLRFPLLASPKLDGIRAVVHRGRVLSKKMIEIPNKHVQSMLQGRAEQPPADYLYATGAQPQFTVTNFEGLDGELIVGDFNDPKAYRKANSGIMSREGKPDFKFHIFDICDERFAKERYTTRLEWLQKSFSACEFAELVPHTFITNMEQFLEYEDARVAEGYEGIMLRDPNGEYKWGTSTLKQGWLLKFKRWLDDEAVIVGFEERMHNANEATLNAAGEMERSSHKANLVGHGDLGSLILKCDKFEKEFGLGTGFDAQERKEIWNNREKYLGKLVKFQHKPNGGFDVPREPSFLGFRDERDM